MKARERARDHYWANREKKIIYAAQYRAGHKEELSAYHVAYSADHKDALATYKKDYFKHSPTPKAYRVKNQAKIKTYQAAYVIKNRAAINTRRREYFQTPTGSAITKHSYHKRRALKKKCENGATATQLLLIACAATECFYCHDKEAKLTVDHFMPLARGGAHSVENIVMACQPCNSRKKDRDPHEFIASMKIAA